MNALARSVVSIGNGRVRLSDDELHRAASKALHEGNHIVFESLPSLVRQIIEHKTWKAYQKASFADYALDETTNGLGVNNNQRLWMLRCAMDVHGDHIKEWADVLAKVEQMVKLMPVAERGSTKALDGNSLEQLAKNTTTLSYDKITFLPSAHKGHDGHLVRLRKNKPDVFKQVVRGELSMVEARKAAGMRVANHTNVSRAQSAVRNMTKAELREFIAWLREQGIIDDRS